MQFVPHEIGRYRKLRDVQQVFLTAARNVARDPCPLNLLALHYAYMNEKKVLHDLVSIPDFIDVGPS